jgi:hypothetical protein
MRIGLGTIAVCACACFAPPVGAETVRALADRTLAAHQFRVTRDMLALEGAQPPDAPPDAGFAPIYEYETRSPRRAFLYSLLIPGAGELYAGNKIKAGAFFVADVAAWGSFFMFRAKGNDKEDEYEAFADDHWKSDDYWDAMLSTRGIAKGEDGDYFPHHLPYDVAADAAIRNHEYYENIGKYDQFVWGWDDRDVTDTIALAGQPDSVAREPYVRSANRLTYVNMREDANKQFDRATVSAIVALSNHLISAFDAAWTAHRFNRSTERAQRFDVNVKMVNLEDTPTPWIDVAYRF